MGIRAVVLGFRKVRNKAPKLKQMAFGGGGSLRTVGGVHFLGWDACSSSAIKTQLRHKKS